MGAAAPARPRGRGGLGGGGRHRGRGGPACRHGAGRAGGRWQAFEEARIGPLVSEGRTVFVDVTADWCITCKFNKAAVLDRGPVAARLAGDVVAMRADWTRPDPAISAYLARFARYGIPFYAVYGPGAPAGLALPELLTDGAVLEAMDKAGRKG